MRSLSYKILLPVALLALTLPSTASAAWSVIAPPAMDFSRAPQSAQLDTANNTFVILGFRSFAIRPPGGTFGETSAFPGSKITTLAFAGDDTSTWLGQATATNVGLIRRSPGPAGAFGTLTDLGPGSAGSLAVTPSGIEVIAFANAPASTDFPATGSGQLVVASRTAVDSEPTVEAIPGGPQAMYDSSQRPIAQLAVDPNGTASLVFQRTASELAVTDRAIDGTWSAPRPLLTVASGTLYDFTFAANAAGGAVLAISHRHPSNPIHTYVAERSAGGTFGATTQLATPEALTQLGSIAITSDGGIALATRTYVRSGFPYYEEFRGTRIWRRVGGAAWTSEHLVGSHVRIATSRASAHIVAAISSRHASPWSGGDSESRFTVHTGTSGSWSATGETPPMVTSPGSAELPVTGVFNDGRVLTMWAGTENEQSDRLYYGAVLDDCTTACTTVQPRRLGVGSIAPRAWGLRADFGSYPRAIHRPVTFEVSAHDIDGHDPLTYHWTVDGWGSPRTMTTTNSFTTSFPTAGTYDVSVEVRDSAGASTETSLSVTIEDDPHWRPPRAPGLWMEATDTGVTINTDRASLHATVNVTKSTTSQVVSLVGTDEAPMVASDSAATGTCTTNATTRTAVCTVPVASHDRVHGVGVSIIGTDANDRIVIRGSVGGMYVSGHDGSDVIDASRLVTAWRTFSLGGGNDTVSTRGCDKTGCAVQIEGGEGSDLVSLARSPVGIPAKRKGHEFKLDADIERVIGSSKADAIVAYGAQSVQAGAGNDVVHGADVPSLVVLGAGNDRFVNSPTRSAHNRVIGGPGSDTFAVEDELNDYVICLDARKSICGRYDGRSGERDEIGSDIEHIDMSRSVASNTLIGSSRANRLTGGAGNDFFIGGQGADTFIGREGTDVVSYEYQPLQKRPVHLSADGRRNDGAPRNDLISTDIEIFAGSVYGDLLVGSARNQGIYGGKGNDRIIGGGGGDYIDGGAGNDAIDSRDGTRARDFVTCGAGRDVVTADKRDIVHKSCEVKRLR